MRELDEARADVLAAVGSLPTEEVGLPDALGRVLAGEVAAPHDVPPFMSSAMDGFAVRAEDVASAPVDLTVVEDLPAGRVALREVVAGSAIKIMTGAPIPRGADTVVRVEVTEEPEPGMVRILETVGTGTAVRPAGGDVEADRVVFSAGTRLAPAHVALLATIGVTWVPVARRPVVAIMSTGDELVAPDVLSLEPGEIRDSNRPLLTALLTELGVEILDLGIVPDLRPELTARLKEAASRADAVVTSGGVSMGEYDLVKQVLAEMGEIEFWQVAMQPAKPFAFGQIDGTPLFGLPGNPVSVLVAFEQLVRPALLEMQGATAIMRPRVAATAGVAMSTDPAKVVFLRVAFRRGVPEAVVEPSGSQSSNVLSAVAAADGFAVVPLGVGDLAEGDPVQVELFRHPETLPWP